MRRWLAPACFLMVLSPSAVALADGDCPPGSWFCEETNVKPPPQAQQQEETEEQETATTPQDAPLPKKKHHKKKAPTDSAAAQGGVELHTQGPVVIYTQGQPQIETPPAPEARALPPAPPPPPAKKKRRWRERFGLNLRGEGAAFASAYGGTSAMGGVGISFRYRPVPMFALDIGGDILGGKDYYKNARIESAFSMTGMLYFNPGSHVQLYALGGLNLTHAEIDNGGGLLDSGWWNTTPHNYIGGHAGLGLEFRVSRHIGLDIDGVGLLRHRIDGGPAEFQDPKTGKTTDTSGAGLFRGGITFWW